MNLSDLSKFLEEWDVNATIPITALTLKRHPELLDVLDLDRMDIAVHGLKHIDYSKLGPEKIKAHIDKAKEIFREDGLNPKGFRAPYLKFRVEMLEILKESGFKYDSSLPIYFGEELKKYKNWWKVEKHLKDYPNLLTSISNLEMRDLVEIPVLLPDDVILVDILNLGWKDSSQIWIEIMKNKLDSNSVLALQIHPERYHILKPALEKVVSFCIDNDIKIMSLAEIAEKIEPPALAISGDIDIVSILDIREVVL